MKILGPEVLSSGPVGELWWSPFLLSFVCIFPELKCPSLCSFITGHQSFLSSKHQCLSARIMGPFYSDRRHLGSILCFLVLRISHNLWLYLIHNTWPPHSLESSPSPAGKEFPLQQKRTLMPYLTSPYLFYLHIYSLFIYQNLYCCHKQAVGNAERSEANGMSCHF